MVEDKKFKNKIPQTNTGQRKKEEIIIPIWDKINFKTKEQKVSDHI